MIFLNVIGNAFGIYYLGLGVEGVAVPTVISRLVAAAAIMHFTLDENFKLHIKRTFKNINLIGKFLKSAECRYSLRY